MSCVLANHLCNQQKTSVLIGKLQGKQNLKKMRSPWIFVLISISSAFEMQNQYKLLQKNFTVVYNDDRVMPFTAGVYNINSTTRALNATFTPKIVLPDNLRFVIVAYKWLSHQYSIGFSRLDRTFKSITETEAFDMQKLLIEYARPPIVWPLEKGVTYRTIGWVPDSRLYPPHLPQGKWKIETTIAFANRTKILVANWFGETVYNK